MAKQYNLLDHTPKNLATQLETLPERGLVLTGSIGRAAWLGQLFDLERANGTASDIDVIDTHHGIETYTQAIDFNALFEEDANLTLSMRPISSQEWGLYTPKHQDDPYAVIDAECMQPQLIEVPWSDGIKTSVLPPEIMAETVGLFGPYKKHPTQMAEFAKFAQNDQLPPEIRRTFQDFRHARAYGETPTERTYILLRRAFRDHAPTSVKETAIKYVGPTIRRLRGTTDG